MDTAEIDRPAARRRLGGDHLWTYASAISFRGPRRRTAYVFTSAAISLIGVQLDELLRKERRAASS